jgi:hypothetical protein
VELGQEDSGNPLIEPAYEWDSAGVFSHGTVMLDPTDRTWKMWYISTPATAPAPSAERRLTYAESSDGLHWKRPMLDVHRDAAAPPVTSCSTSIPAARHSTPPCSCIPMRPPNITTRCSSCAVLATTAAHIAWSGGFRYPRAARSIAAVSSDSPQIAQGYIKTLLAQIRSSISERRALWPDRLW